MEYFGRACTFPRLFASMSRPYEVNYDSCKTWHEGSP